MEICGCFFAEFDPIVGPKISHVSPEHALPAEVFDSISDYIIPKPQLCGKALSVRAFGRCLLGFPSLIPGPKYSRNALQFNLGLIIKNSNADEFASDHTTDLLDSFEPIVRKVARYLTTLEVEDEFLFREDTKKMMKNVVKELFEGLSSQGECKIQMNDVTTMHLKIFPSLPNPPNIPEYMVPLLLVDLSTYPTDSWDLTLQQIIPFLNGVYHVKRIASESQVRLSLVTKCLQHLLYFRAITLVDIFQFCNVYVTTSLFTDLLSGRSGLESECVEFVKRSDIRACPLFEVCCALYAQLTAGLVYSDFCRANAMWLANNNIDERRFVQYGMARGFIRCRRNYPLRVVPPRAAKDAPYLPPQIVKLLDGGHCYAAICCEIGAHESELMDLLEADPFTVTLKK